ncbi:MAG TPA: A24 family peptidase [Terracidiphilus sp.]|jgi:prepilin peptidase CpaA
MNGIAWWPTLLVLGIATYTDLRTRRIPNWLVFPFLLLGTITAGWLHGWQGLGHSLEGAGLGMLIYGFLFWAGGMGAGDVKLCAAIGAWVGPEQLLIAMVLTGLAGGIMALIWAAAGGFMKDLFSDSARLIFGPKEWGHFRDTELTLSNPRRRRMPYGPAIATGTILSFFAR